MPLFLVYQSYICYDRGLFITPASFGLAERLLAHHRLSSTGRGRIGSAITHKKSKNVCPCPFSYLSRTFLSFPPSAALLLTICRDGLVRKFRRALTAGAVDIALHARIADIKLAQPAQDLFVAGVEML